MKTTLFVLLVIALVSLPFVVFGEDMALTFLRDRDEQAVWLTAIAVVLLAADAVAPVPSTFVIMFLAAKAGWLAGVIGGTLGLTAGVVGAWWFGRYAVGRVAPRFFPEAELVRLRAGIQRRLGLTLVCWRSVPVLAETSVIVAAAAGVPLRRVVAVTFVPNLAIAAIYAFAADESWVTAVLAFFATLLVSLALWCWRGREVAQATNE